MLADGYYDIPPGKQGAIVTHLEMRAQAQARPCPPSDGVALTANAEPQLDWYRRLIRTVGGPWLWSERLELSDDALGAILRHTDVSIWSLQRGGRDVGIVELDWRDMPTCELAFFGVTQDLAGTTAARNLMNFAIRQAWSRPIERFYVHTCTFDHPRALAFYMRSGFVPTRQQVEIGDDPRLTGHYPEDIARGVPIIRP